MTGFGAARTDDMSFHVSAEVRAINNKYLKVTTKAAEPYNVFEPEIERLVRSRVRRGTVQIMLRVYREPSAEEFQLNQTAIQAYVAQLKAIAPNVDVAGALGHVLGLPGVVVDWSQRDADPMDLWPRVAPVVQQALERLHAMRVEEGRAMRAELVENCTTIRRSLDAIAARAPAAIEEYRDRLHERVKNMLTNMEIQLAPADLIKEVSIFAERSDIAEEIVRLKSHLDQFMKVIDEPESSGRKLEFVSQEMFREANTIGSKASDVEISRRSVEIKGSIERIRELVQNVE
jgi:uncharacterized protein (TIGR00255 family)